MTEFALASTEHLIDSIRFDLAVEKTVIQEYVTLTLDVTTITQTKGSKKDTIEKQIKTALKKFVDARWEFSNVRRYKEAMGYERIVLKAVAQIHSKEDVNLEERAREASSEGIALANPNVDYSLPSSVIGDTLKELGEETFQLLNERIGAYNRLTGRTWRLGDLQFAPKDVRVEDYNPKRAYFQERDEESLMRAGHVKLVSRVILKANASEAAA